MSDTELLTFHRCIDGGDGGDEEVTAGSLEEALADAIEWAEGGSWDTWPDEDGDSLTYRSITAEVSVTREWEDDDGPQCDHASDEILAWDADEDADAILPRSWQCDHEDGHAWEKPDDGFDGVRSHGGMAMSQTLTCKHCGMTRTNAWDHVQNWHDDVTYTRPLAGRDA